MLPGRGRIAFTVVEVLTIVAIAGLLAALTLPALQKARAAAQRVRCANQLRQIGLTLAAHHSEHGVYPIGTCVAAERGRRVYMGWHVRVLPFLGQEALWRTCLDAFDAEPEFSKNPPHIGLSHVVAEFVCPSDQRVQSAQVYVGVEVAFTSYLGNAGLDQLTKDGILFTDSTIRAGDVGDGLSNTLLAGERPPDKNFGYGWWYAGVGQDWNGSCDSALGVREINRCGQKLTRPGCGAGPYHLVAGSLASQCDIFHYWSLHAGGTHFVFGDGAVRFLNYSADAIMPALGTRNGSETDAIPD